MIIGITTQMVMPLRRVKPAIFAKLRKSWQKTLRLQNSPYATVPAALATRSQRP